MKKLFFRSTMLIFRALPKHLKDSVSAKMSAPQAKFKKNLKKIKKAFIDPF